MMSPQAKGIHYPGTIAYRDRHSRASGNPEVACCGCGGIRPGLLDSRLHGNYGRVGMTVRGLSGISNCPAPPASGSFPLILMPAPFPLILMPPFSAHPDAGPIPLILNLLKDGTRRKQRESAIRIPIAAAFIRSS